MRKRGRRTWDAWREKHTLLFTRFRITICETRRHATRVKRLVTHCVSSIFQVIPDVMCSQQIHTGFICFPFLPSSFCRLVFHPPFLKTNVLQQKSAYLYWGISFCSQKTATHSTWLTNRSVLEKCMCINSAWLAYAPSESQQLVSQNVHHSVPTHTNTKWCSCFECLNRRVLEESNKSQQLTFLSLSNLCLSFGATLKSLWDKEMGADRNLIHVRSLSWEVLSRIVISRRGFSISTSSSCAVIIYLSHSLLISSDASSTR